MMTIEWMHGGGRSVRKILKRQMRVVALCARWCERDDAPREK